MWRIILVALFALVGCKHEPTGPGIEVEEEVLRDRMCACPDVACAMKVADDSVKLGQRASKTVKPGERNERFETAAKQMAECSNRVMTAGLAPVDAAPADAAPPSKYGSCKVTFTGAVDATMEVALTPKDVGSEHWLSAEEAAAGKKRVAAAEKREGIDLGDSHRMLEFACGDGKIAYVNIQPTLKTMDSKLRAFKAMPGDYPIVSDDDTANAFHGSIGAYAVQGIGLGRTTGTLHITRFDQGELEASFEVDIEAMGDAPAKAHLEGTIQYHCADYDRCGRGGPT